MYRRVERLIVHVKCTSKQLSVTVDVQKYHKRFHNNGPYYMTQCVIWTGHFILHYCAIYTYTGKS